MVLFQVEVAVLFTDQRWSMRTFEVEAVDEFGALLIAKRDAFGLLADDEEPIAHVLPVRAFPAPRE